MESQRRSERTKAGLTKAVAHGKRLGGPKGARAENGVKNGRPELLSCQV